MAEKDPRANKDGKVAKDGKPAAATENPAGSAVKNLGKKKIVVIAAVGALLVLGGGGAAAWMLLGSNGEQGAGLEDGKARRKKTPVFVDLETFTANLRDDDDDRFIQVKLVAEVSDAPAGEMLKTLMPTVRNEILLLLGSKESKDLATRDGKEKLAAEIVAAANQTLVDTAYAGAVQSVNFTHIIVQ